MSNFIVQLVLLHVLLEFLSTFMYRLLYHAGVTRIGREDAPVPQDITIQGPGIEAEHCCIINEGWCSVLKLLLLFCTIHFDYC